MKKGSLILVIGILSASLIVGCGKKEVETSKNTENTTVLQNEQTEDNSQEGEAEEEIDMSQMTNEELAAMLGLDSADGIEVVGVTEGYIDENGNEVVTSDNSSSNGSSGESNEEDGTSQENKYSDVYGAKRGDDRYKEEYDVNKDGVINVADIYLLENNK